MLGLGNIFFRHNGIVDLFWGIRLYEDNLLWGRRMSGAVQWTVCFFMQPMVEGCQKILHWRGGDRRGPRISRICILTREGSRRKTGKILFSSLMGFPFPLFSSNAIGGSSSCI